MRLALVVSLTILSTLLTPVVAAAQSEDKPTAAVSMGDSYLSGQGGRWQGNSYSDWGDRRGTDRAAFRRGWFWRYDRSRVYGDTVGGCNRSDVAPLLSAELDVDQTFNIACAGSATSNLLSADSGGRSFNGEAPQVDQLARIAETHDIEVVVVSSGGNDLGFAPAIIDCVISYTIGIGNCSGRQDAAVNRKLPSTLDRLTTAVEQIKATLEAAGDEDYRIIVQSYPVPITDGSDFRYRERGLRRTLRGGCPFTNDDADWATDDLVPTIRDGMAKVAANTGVEFLDLTDALDGHEPCSNRAVQGNREATGEWLRFVTTGIAQGDAGESLHPNYFGQQAMGRCLGLMVAADPGNYRCNNLPDRPPSEMTLSSR